MNFKATAAAVAAAMLLPLAAQAQNIAIVNGKPVPKARLDTLLKSASRGGAVAPEMEARARDEVVLREIFVQEAERKGIAATPEYKAQLELARQTLLIRELFAKYQESHKVSDQDAQAEYDRVKAEAKGQEIRARHILVENEDEAKKLIADIKAGASFEDMAKKHSKDPGSAENGGDLDFAKPETYVPEFGKAIGELKKGEMTQTPVKTQFGWHIIKVEDTRETQFPSFEEVKPQVVQSLSQMRLQKYQEDLRKAAKTDYKFADPAAPH